METKKFKSIKNMYKYILLNKNKNKILKYS